MTTDYYESMVPSAHLTKSKFMGMLRALIEPTVSAMASMDSIIMAFDPDNASGPQLDVLGELVGVKRLLPFLPADGSSRELTDEEYRLMIELKIAKNSWDGTNGEAVRIYNELFPNDVSVEYVDNMNGTINIYVHMATTRQVEILKGTNNLLVPAGIQCTVTQISDDSTAVAYPGTAVSGIGVYDHSIQEE